MTTNEMDEFWIATIKGIGLETSTETLALRLVLAAGLGILVGWQRQRSDSGPAGIRTFPLITGSGCLAAMLNSWFPWLAAGGLAAIGILVTVTHYLRQTSPNPDPGITTEMAMLLMYLVGVCLGIGLLQIGVAVGAGVAVLLHAKPQMHRLVHRIGEEDFTAMMRFVLITLVILPVLPNRNLGPYHVLNPFKIWLLVVLIVGISLAGYVTYKIVGAKAGQWLLGILGGLISSTATTVTFARRAKEEPQSLEGAAFVIQTASTVLFLRIGLILLFVSQKLFRHALLPLACLAGLCMIVCIWQWRRAKQISLEGMQHTNPSEIGSALLFAGIFAVILVATAAAREFLGRGGLYVVSALSGLTDVDAITLSTAEMVRQTGLDLALGWRMILVAVAANAVFKYGVTCWWGGRQMALRTGPFFGLQALGAIGLVLSPLAP